MTDISRIEVIDHTEGKVQGGGRVFVHWDNRTEVSTELQDDSRTLKVFIRDRGDMEDRNDDSAKEELAQGDDGEGVEIEAPNE